VHIVETQTITQKMRCFLVSVAASKEVNSVEMVLQSESGTRELSRMGSE
jgi:hypothetical protein